MPTSRTGPAALPRLLRRRLPTARGLSPSRHLLARSATAARSRLLLPFPVLSTSCPASPRVRSHRFVAELIAQSGSTRADRRTSPSSARRVGQSRRSTHSCFGARRLPPSTTRRPPRSRRSRSASFSAARSSIRVRSCRALGPHALPPRERRRSARARLLDSAARRHPQRLRIRTTHRRGAVAATVHPSSTAPPLSRPLWTRPGIVPVQAAALSRSTAPVGSTTCCESKCGRSSTSTGSARRTSARQPMTAIRRRSKSARALSRTSSASSSASVVARRPRSLPALTTRPSSRSSRMSRPPGAF